MTTDDQPRTYRDIARQVAAEYGMTDISDADCEYLLWECSPYPVSLDPDLIERALHRTLSTETSMTTAEFRVVTDTYPRGRPVEDTESL